MKSIQAIHKLSRDLMLSLFTCTCANLTPKSLILGTLVGFNFGHYLVRSWP